MSRRTAAAAAIAAVGVIAVAGAAVAATGPGMGYGNGYGNGNGNGRGTAVGSPLHDGSGGAFGGWGRAGGSAGRGAGGQGLGARGQGSSAATHGSDIPAAVPNATISADVAHMLAFMVQEEKLARDVYALAIDAYGDRVFVNINRSESNHMAELQVLLDRYDVPDPTANAVSGRFAEDELTAMYAGLADKVGTDRAGAIDAGIAVETADIADLKDALELTAPADVTAVLENLLAGSERHLAAFQRNA
jgi:hypothetical protein